MARRINLIPRTERPRTKTDWGLLATVGLFIVVIFGLGFGYYTFSNVLDERKQELADLEVQTTKLEQQVQALRAYELLASQREGVQSVVQSIYTSRTLLSDVLDAVSLVIPDNAWFQSLELSATDPGEATDSPGSNKGGSITISGKTYSFEDISRLVVRLQLVPALNDVQLTQANEEPGSEETGTVDVKSFSIGAAVGNVEPGGSLPLTEVEVPAR
jgi:Tfp pilus assembly protein PilN